MDEIFEKFNDSAAQSSFGADGEKYKMLGALPYIIPVFFFVPIMVDKDSSYCKFHANQQLCWLIVMVALCIISGILGIIPFLGKIIKAIIVIAILALICFFAYGTYKGYAIKVPILGDMLEIFK